MTFSVIIPAYNASRYIERCIESVKTQVFTDFECIIVNDGSTDSTLEVCRPLIANDSRFILIDSENEGVSSARNKGLERALGEYVLFVDADDWVEPSWLQELSLQCHGVDIVQFDFFEAGIDTKKELHIDSNVDMIVQGEGAVV
ncbi:MAG: glycosyltransferase family 2 protein [Bacteroidales bacterium]|nr:glycosyltransferase family 2 protein [Bacteroidales bacterium]